MYSTHAGGETCCAHKRAEILQVTRPATHIDAYGSSRRQLSAVQLEHRSRYPRLRGEAAGRSISRNLGTYAVPRAQTHRNPRKSDASTKGIGTAPQHSYPPAPAAAVAAGEWGIGWNRRGSAALSFVLRAYGNGNANLARVGNVQGSNRETHTGGNGFTGKRWWKLRARCGAETTMSPQTGQSVGTSHSRARQRGQRKPARFSSPWHVHSAAGAAVGSLVGKPISIRSAPLAAARPSVLEAARWAGGGMSSKRRSLK
jgi:hypothetical protein